MAKTVYIWDLANTLFPEHWDKEQSGYGSYDEYALAHNIDGEDPRAYEEGYKEPLVRGELSGLAIADGYKEVLEWTAHNETFSTGTVEQMDWRAQYLNPIVGFDIRTPFQKFRSTFDFAHTNIKTKAMLVAILDELFRDGYRAVVYTDDSKKNCEQFMHAIEEFQYTHSDFEARIYQFGVDVHDLWELKQKEENRQ